MKSGFFEVCLNGVTFLALIFSSLGIVVASRFLTLGVFGDYHVIVDVLVWFLCYGLLSALLVRLALRWKPLLPGEYLPDHPTARYWRWLTVHTHFGLGALLPITNILTTSMIFRLFGTNVGKHVVLAGTIDTPFLVTVGKGSILGKRSIVSADVLLGEKTIIGPVRIGEGTVIGAHSILFPNTEVGDHVTLHAGSVVSPGTAIPNGENWRGNPARKWL